MQSAESVQAVPRGSLAAGVPWPSAQYPLLRCLAIYREMPGRFALTAALFIVVHLSLAWQQWLVGHAIDETRRGLSASRLADGSVDTSAAWHWMLVLIGVALARGALQYAAGYSAIIIGQGLLSILRERILVHVQRLHLGYHWQHGIGELVTRTTRDADKVRDALVGFWRQLVETVLVVIAAIGLLLWYDLSLGAVPLLLTLAGIVIFFTQADRLVTLDRAAGAAYDRVNQDLSEGITGVRVIKSFGLERSRVLQFGEQVRVFAEQARAALAYSCSRIPVPQAIVALGHVWILAYGAILVSTGRLEVGELVASLLMATTLVFRVESVGRVIRIFADARASAARIWELLDAEPAIRGGSAPVPAGALGLRLSNVTLSAVSGGTRVLQDCSFTVEPGEIVALVGATGSGKSTLASLLPRLADADHGVVAVGSDAAGWSDVRELDLRELRRRVHVVPQESFLFSDTLAANLRVGAPDATDDELRTALQLAAADEVLAGLKDGFETRIGDRGITLSGGQRQRVSLARAIVGQPDVLVLDDATSALDAVTEQRILLGIRSLRRSHGHTTTLLIIASKLSTILLADRVVMLSDGRISAAGTHADLVEHNAAYRDLLGLDHAS